MDTVAGVLYIEVGNIKQKGMRNLCKTIQYRVLQVFCVLMYSLNTEIELYIYIYIYMIIVTLFAKTLL